MTRYEDLIDPTARINEAAMSRLAPRSTLAPPDTLVTIDNGKPGGAVLLRAIGEELTDRRGVALERRRKKGASTPYHEIDDVVRPRTFVVAALGD